MQRKAFLTLVVALLISSAVPCSGADRVTPLQGFNWYNEKPEEKKKKPVEKHKELAIVNRKYDAARARWYELLVKDYTTPYTDDCVYQVQKYKELANEIKDLEEEALKLNREVQ